MHPLEARRAGGWAGTRQALRWAALAARAGERVGGAGRSPSARVKSSTGDGHFHAVEWKPQGPVQERFPLHRFLHCAPGGRGPAVGEEGTRIGRGHSDRSGPRDSSDLTRAPCLAPGERREDRTVGLQQEAVLPLGKGGLARCSVHRGSGMSISEGNDGAWGRFPRRPEMLFALTRECICKNIL